MFVLRQFSNVVGVALTLILALTTCQRRSDETANQNASAVAQRSQAGPRHDLGRDEEAGGHTLRKHVSLSDEQLRERLKRENNLAAASTYTDRETAERALGLVLNENREKISHWLSRAGRRPNLVLDYQGDPARPLGRTLDRGENHSRPCSHAVVVLRWKGDHDYYVLTSYPECR